MFVSTGAALAAVGIGAGVANAAPASPAIAGPQYISENKPGHDDGPGHGRGHDDWWWRDNGPRQWNPIDACVGVQGPFGYVQGSACI